MKYSALVLFLALAVFWSSAEARYNKYQDEVIDSMTKWALEETSNVPEPYKTRIADTINESKNKQWNSVGDYFKNLSEKMREIAIEILTQRSKRSVEYAGFAEQLQQISAMGDHVERGSDFDV